MFIAIVDVNTAAVDRAAALALLDSEHDEVHAMPGNIAFRVYASRADDTGITIVHEWDEQASMARYLSSDTFARFGAELRPMLITTPVSRRFSAELLETVA
jgi:quinol monooxygenase YgiN